VENLERGLKEQGAGLQQMATWLSAMQASSTIITAHMEQMNAKLDHMHSRSEEHFGTVNSKLDALLVRAGSSVPNQATEQQQPRQVFVVPKLEVRSAEASQERAMSGAFGSVFKAAKKRASSTALGTAVKAASTAALGSAVKAASSTALGTAVKAASSTALGTAVKAAKDRAVQIYTNQGLATKDCSQEIKVEMELVYGKDLHTWLSENDNCCMADRVKLAAQVR
jgi:hypothetical protein